MRSEDTTKQGQESRVILIGVGEEGMCRSSVDCCLFCQFRGALYEEYTVHGDYRCVCTLGEWNN